MREREITRRRWSRGEKARVETCEGKKDSVGEQRSSRLATICISALCRFSCFIASSSSFFFCPLSPLVFFFLFSLSLSLSSFLSSYCSRTKVGKTFGVFFSPGQPTISAVRASDNETDRPSLIGPFRPIKSEFFRARRKRRGNGPESDFGRS